MRNQVFCVGLLQQSLLHMSFMNSVTKGIEDIGDFLNELEFSNKVQFGMTVINL